jgi:probable phosphoglycerate mutase
MQLPYDGFIRYRIYLVRHGHALGGGEKSARYATDISLTPRGVAEAEAMRDFLRDVPFDEAWSSDISRSQETAGIVLQGRALELQTSPAYREIATDPSMALRKGQGDINAQLQNFAYQLWRANVPEARLFDNGDSFGEYFNRVSSAMEQFVLAASGRTLLLVAHSGFNRAALCWAVGAPLSSFGAFEQDTCCLNILDIDVDPANRKIMRRHLRLANFSPLHPAKSALLLTDSEESAQKMTELLEKLALAG